LLLNHWFVGLSGKPASAGRHIPAAQHVAHSIAAARHALLQGVLAVAQACGMQGLLKAAGIAYKVCAAA
jgi:hypothetical protein